MNLLPTYFNQVQLLFLFSAGITFILSLIFFLNHNSRLTYLFLFLTAGLTFSFAASLDPFLNLWDERFHALVAKNLSIHPLKPTLYDDPIVDTDYSGWWRSAVWVHKQPFFLWQMALSYKLFGPSEFAIRIPSVILGAIQVLITFRSGTLLVNKTVGFIAAILLITSFYFSELIAGRQTLDHNDLAFVAYVSLSIWSLIEYQISGKKKWIIFIGLFSGLAILNKWLVGLLVYLGWFILKAQQKKFKLSDYKDFFISLLITVFIALPWQIFIFLQYPREAALAYEFNTTHFLEALEGHAGNFWYHLNNLNLLYGHWASLVLLPGFIVLFFRTNEKKLFYSLAGMIVIIYLFFSIAKTKMPSFPLVVVMPIYIALAAFVDYMFGFINKIHLPKWAVKMIFILIIFFLVLTRFDVMRLQKSHATNSENNHYSMALIHNKQVFTSLDLPENTVLFNVYGTHYIEAMYYTGFPSYNFIPSKEQYLDLKQKGRVIALFQPDYDLPDYLINEPAVIIINEKIENERYD